MSLQQTLQQQSIRLLLQIKNDPCQYWDHLLRSNFTVKLQNVKNIVNYDPREAAIFTRYLELVTRYFTNGNLGDRHPITYFAAASAGQPAKIAPLLPKNDLKMKLFCHFRR